MVESYRINILPEAATNLEGIHEFVQKDSPQNAVIVSRRLLRAIDSLQQFPHRYKVHTSARIPDRIVHSMPVPPFIVYYRIIERNLAVEGDDDPSRRQAAAAKIWVRSASKDGRI